MYTNETMSELYNIEELPEGMFPLSFNFVVHYKQEYHLLTKKRKCAEFTKGYFCKVRNTIDLITY